jgi:hypothetical protein
VVFKRTAFEKAPRWVAVDFRHRGALMRCSFFYKKGKNSPTYAIGGKRGKMKKWLHPTVFQWLIYKEHPRKPYPLKFIASKRLKRCVR